MAKAEGGQDVTAMTDGQMFEELIKIHAQSAGEAISSILKISSIWTVLGSTT
jgi:flagellar motor switch protein FliN/FliY